MKGELAAPAPGTGTILTEKQKAAELNEKKKKNAGDEKKQAKDALVAAPAAAPAPGSSARKPSTGLLLLHSHHLC